MDVVSLERGAAAWSARLEPGSGYWMAEAMTENLPLAQACLAASDPVAGRLSPALAPQMPDDL